MWLRCTSDDQPVLINADRVIKIVGNTTDDDARGCLLYLSMTEYLTIDQTLAQIMSHLGFEDRG